MGSIGKRTIAGERVKREIEKNRKIKKYRKSQRKENRKKEKKKKRHHS